MSRDEWFLIGESPEWWLVSDSAPLRVDERMADAARLVTKSDVGHNPKYHYLSHMECVSCGSFIRYKATQECVPCRQKSRKLRGNWGEVGRRAWRVYNYECMKCGSIANLQLDHIVPRSLGGGNTFSNLQILCKSCNCKKGNRNSTDYRPT